MTLAPIVAASLNVGLPTRTRALWIQGMDVLKAPGAPGNRYGVDPTTVVVTEADAGQVSSLSAVITDPQGELSIAPASFVQYQDLANNLPIFSGFTSSPVSRQLGVGRSIELECDGVEILLDWMKVPAMTVPAGLDSYAAVAMVVAAATGLGYSLKVNGLIVGGSLQATPMDMGSTTITTQYDVVFTRPVSLRDALDQVGRAAASNYAALGAPPAQFRFTVDPYLGLRSWDQSGVWGFAQPNDYTAPTFAPTGGGLIRPSGTEYTPAIGVHAVYVQGGNVAGTGIVTDGTGIPSDIPVIVDTLILTDSAKRAAGVAYLAQHGGQARGSVTAEEASQAVSIPTGEVRPGAAVTITDPQAGIPTPTTFVVRQITRQYLANGKENTTFDFGAELESGAMMLRRLTRATLS